MYGIVPHRVLFCSELAHLQHHPEVLSFLVLPPHWIYLLKSQICILFVLDGQFPPPSTVFFVHSDANVVGMSCSRLRSSKCHRRDVGVYANRCAPVRTTPPIADTESAPGWSGLPLRGQTTFSRRRSNGPLAITLSGCGDNISASNTTMGKMCPSIHTVG